MSKTRAKFICHYIAPHSDGSHTIHMQAVYSSDPDSENRKFSDATPNGHLQMSIKAGGPLFKQGAEYFLDFSEAPASK